MRAKTKRMIEIDEDAKVAREAAREAERQRLFALKVARAQKAKAALRRWQTRAKIAAGKVRKLKRRVAYYGGIVD